MMTKHQRYEPKGRLTLGIIACALLCIVQVRQACGSNGDSTCISNAIDVIGGRYCEVSFNGRISAEEKTNPQPIGVCKFMFVGEDGALVKADSAQVYGCGRGDAMSAFEYLYGDPIQTNSTGEAEWLFQVRAPDNAVKAIVLVDKWRPIKLVSFSNLQVRMCLETYAIVSDTHFAHKIVSGESGDAKLTCRGMIREYDGAQVRKRIPIQLRFVPFDPDTSEAMSEIVQMIYSDNQGAFSCDINYPEGVFAGEVFVSSKTGKLKFRLCEFRVISRHEPIVLPSCDAPKWRQYDVSGQLNVSGVLLPVDPSNAHVKAGMCLIRFMDAAGNVLHAKGLAASKTFGDYFYLKSASKAMPFQKMLIPPSGAVKVKVGFVSFKSRVQLFLERAKVKSKLLPPKCFWLEMGYTKPIPEDMMLRHPEKIQEALERQIGIDEVARLLADKDVPNIKRPLNISFLPQTWKDDSFDRNIVIFEHFNGFNIANGLNWNEDPYQSVTWQSNLNAGYWIPFMCRGLPEDEYYESCKKLWMSFFAHHAYPFGACPAAYCEHCCAARVEAILTTMFGIQKHSEDGVSLPSLVRYLSNDVEFRKKLLLQLITDVRVIDYHLQMRSMGIHNHNVIMARALLQFADCFAKYSFAAHYRKTAMDTIFSHFNEMFESDGFIREQSAAYHLTFTKYFMKLYDYMLTNKSVGKNVLDKMRSRLAMLLSVNLAVKPPDGMTIPMGDATICKLNKACSDLIEEINCSGAGDPLKFKFKFNEQENVNAYPISGLYIFRNPMKKRWLTVDISDVLKVHGHYDLGSWMYFSNTNRWVSDPGGPFQYGSAVHRTLRQSEGHNLMSPVNRRQTTGQAYAVEFDEYTNGWVLAFKTNVYGPDYDHTRTFRILKDLSAFRIEDRFLGPKGQDYCNRFVSGVNCNVRIPKDSKHGRMVNAANESLHFRFSGDSSRPAFDIRKICPDYNRLISAKEIVSHVIATNGVCTSVIDIGEDIRAFDQIDSIEGR